MTPFPVQKVILATATLLLTTTLAIPVTYDIARRESECLFDRIADKEHVTLAVTILSGSTLSATAMIAGPFTPAATSNSAELYSTGNLYRDQAKTSKKPMGRKHLFHSYPVTFEDLYNDDDYDDDDGILNDDDIDWDDDDMDDATFRDYYYDIDDDDDDLEYAFMEDDSMTEKEIADLRKMKESRTKMTSDEKEAEKKQKKEESMAEAKIMFAKRKETREKRKTHKESLLHGKNHKREMTAGEKLMVHMKSGQAFMATHQIEVGGWYMVCIEAESNRITAEIEMRKSSDVGGPNHKTGHLQTYERHAMLQKEKKLFGEGRHEAEQRKLDLAKKAKEAGDANLPIPDAIQAKDLTNSKGQMQRLNRLLNDIKEKQQNERHRLSIHAALNEHSHSRMVLSSLFETVFYIGVSGFQVYTIRKWFRGNPILGY